MYKELTIKGVSIVTIAALLGCIFATKTELANAVSGLKIEKTDALVTMKEDIAAIKTDISWIKEHIANKE
jgi:hypothetical protein